MVTIVKHKQYGLLRDRIKHKLHITINRNTKTNIGSIKTLCKAKDIDQDTFKMVYDRYQRYFCDIDALRWAVEADNLVIVQTLLHQTYPVIFERGHELLIHALTSPSITVLKYLMDSGLFDNDRLLTINLNRVHGPGVVPLDKFFRSPDALRIMREDVNNFPQEFLDKFISKARMHVNNILASRDQQHINELLFKEGVMMLPNFRITSEMMKSGPNVSPAEQLAHFLRLLPHMDIDQQMEANNAIALLSSKKTTQAILSKHGMLDHNNNNNNNITMIDDAQLMVFVKLYQLNVQRRHSDKLNNYALRQYIATGDCMLIPFFLGNNGYPLNRHDVDVLFSTITQRGTVTQAMVTMEYLQDQSGNNYNIDSSGPLSDQFHFFNTADDMSRSFEIIKYLNSTKRIVQPQALSYTLFNGTMEMLEFLLSDDNRIFSKNVVRYSLVLEPDQLEYFFKVKPEMFEWENTMRFAVSLARLDSLSILLDHIPSKLSMSTRLLFHLVLTNGGHHMEVIRMLVEKGNIKPSYGIFPTIGRMGDIAFFDYCLANYEYHEHDFWFEKMLIGQNEIDYIPEKALFGAIECNQVNMIKHLYQHHMDVLLDKHYHLQAVIDGNLEVLEVLLAVDPLNPNNKKDEQYMDELLLAAMWQGHIETLDFLLEHLDQDYCTRFMAYNIVIKPFVENSDVAMLQHLLDIGISFDLRSIHTMKEFKSSQAIQSIVAQSKEKRAKLLEQTKLNSVKKRKSEDDVDETATTTSKINKRNKRK
ncbi:hypothetical protein SAMD00019534_064770 [Acytostelium subglobosum LB1]|uniref:hypothetical protein n=1 Tax=Acytostelium subglobosum LB1 TaxID=1410327 RepID=UPI000644DE14|nr:hypothetical protein SAMD00019534_064770 [Acytostelium subglobosum LB1]GAM23302.1 hypothetical protein SAMD00019534_064770 [Acytostelium subglobosum LB1]|eukprot:XP_012753751.1 hypothetical protein SAMD00019534_064770 [Acytostelium subglobosum LB1]